MRHVYCHACCHAHDLCSHACCQVRRHAHMPLLSCTLPCRLPRPCVSPCVLPCVLPSPMPHCQFARYVVMYVCRMRMRIAMLIASSMPMSHAYCNVRRDAGAMTTFSGQVCCNDGWHAHAIICHGRFVDVAMYVAMRNCICTYVCAVCQRVATWFVGHLVTCCGIHGGNVVHQHRVLTSQGRLSKRGQGLDRCLDILPASSKVAQADCVAGIWRDVDARPS